MKAVQFTTTIPRYALGLGLRKVAPALLWSGIACVGMRAVTEPALPSAEWVKIRTHLGGICGTDLSIIHLHTSPYFSPFSSSPFTFGHENVGVIAEVGTAVTGWQVGQRVLVEPTLWCRPRGFTQLCPACARGQINRCECVTQGGLAPGLMLGSCRDTGGSWSPMFVAHQSQLYAVPEAVSDANALMVEPFACGLHAVLQVFPDNEDSVLILGAGTIGLVTLAALRSLGSKARILIAARYPFQADMAQQLGADEIVQNDDLYTAVAAQTGANLHKPLVGKRVVAGGVDHVFDCVGSDSALDDALRLARPGGRVTLVGVPGLAKGIDWSAVLLQELQINAAYIYHHAEQFNGRVWRTFELALHLIESGQIDLSPLVTHHFALDDYARALKMHMFRRKYNIIKGVFDFSQR